MMDVNIEDTIMPIPTLAEALSEYGAEAYLLTMTTDGPLTSSVAVEFYGNVIACTLGKSAAKNPQWHRGVQRWRACRDHTDQVRASPGEPFAGRQRGTLPIEMPKGRAAGLTLGLSDGRATRDQA